MKIYRSPETITIPNIDLLTYLFDSEYSAFRDVPPETILHVDAATPENVVTKGHFLAHTEQFAHGLRHHYGIGANGPNKDVVVLMSTGQPLVPCLFYGIIAAGGVVSSASHSFTAAELARQIDQGGSRLLVCSPDLEHVAVAAAERASLDLRRVVVLSSSPRWSLRSVAGGIDCWSDQRLTWKRITDPEELKKSLIVLLYSSGTTGVPKSVMLSHLNLVAETHIPTTMNKRWLEKQGPPPPTPPYRTLAHLPIAHIAGLLGYCIGPIMAGGTCYWMTKYEWQPFITYMKKHQITSFYTVPSIYLRISKSPDVTDHFKSVVGATTGAAKMDAALQQAANARLGDGEVVKIGQTWGLSETTGAVTARTMDQEADDTGGISAVLPNVEIRLVDDDMRDVLEEGAPGELIVRGPVVTNGYFDNPAATRDAFRDGWFCSGDVAVRRGGKFYIVDRKKEVIKYKGLQIAPAELEMLLSSHPKIQEAAVVGIPSDDEDEVPRAYIVADPAAIDVEEVETFVKQNLAPHKQLRGGVRFVREIPKNAIGKMLRRELRETALREKRQTSRL